MIVAVGAAVPDALAATGELNDAGIPTDLVCLTSADLVFRAVRARQGLADDDEWILDALFPAERRAPIVSVLDGHPHTLSFLGSVRQTPTTCLGVTDFGQSGDVDDLHRHFGIDAETIVGAALDLVEDGVR